MMDVLILMMSYNLSLLIIMKQRYLAPDTICFEGAETVTQAFSASITADVSDLPYDVISSSIGIYFQIIQLLQ